MKAYAIFRSKDNCGDQLIELDGNEAEAIRTVEKLNAVADHETAYHYYDINVNVSSIDIGYEQKSFALMQVFKDAERYRWLRQQPNDTSAPRIDVVRWTENDDANEGEGLRLEDLDEAIDVELNKGYQNG